MATILPPRHHLVGAPGVTAGARDHTPQAEGYRMNIAGSNRWLASVFSAALAASLVAGEKAAAQQVQHAITPETAGRASDQAAEKWLQKGIAGFSVAILQDGKL